VVTNYSKEKKRVSIESARGVELLWNGEGALVDGKTWPVLSKTAVRLPPGSHTVEPAARRDALTVEDLNATLRSASAEGKRLAFEYASDSRAIVRFDRRPQQLELDGAALPIACIEGTDCAVLLPKGNHKITAN
jgi:hypothetical protein